MKKEDIARLRLQSQQLSGTAFTSAHRLVSHMGAMQAQDYAMCRWAIAARLKAPDLADIQHDIDSGKIVRTHVMRPTWHVVAAEDLRWMLELTAPRIKSSMNSRAKQLNIDAAALKKHERLLASALQDGPLKRDAIMSLYKKEKIETGDNRASHLLMYAELDSLICSGPDVDGKPTYTLVDAHLSQTKANHPADPAVALAKRYFESHGPATAADFSWWSALSLSTCKKAAEHLGKDFEAVEVENQVYYLPKGMEPKPGNALLLPAFDEFLISYKDRSAALEDVHNKKVISNNGIFNPLVVFDGQVEGTWKRTVKNDTVDLHLDTFQPLSAKEKKAITIEAHRFADFLGKRPTLHFDIK